MASNAKKEFLQKLEDRTLVAGVVGLGYVGLPLAMLFTESGFRSMGYDLDSNKTTKLNKGQSYINYIPNQSVKKMVKGGFEATTEFKRLAEADTISICVPTPLNENREPDLQYVEQTAIVIAEYLRPGQLIILESTTYPGTTEELVLPILERTGLKVGQDFFLAYSPEREDPNNPDFTAKKIPKVIGGQTKHCLQLAKGFYGRVFDEIVPVSSPGVAEMSKLLENIYRSVNIALVNELKVVTDAMGINIWEVIKAASTKPFGFKPFFPGPGLGGHCIPIDPFYLTWKARQYGYNTRFIELAGEVNTSMPDYVVHKTVSALNRQKKAMAGAKILVLGVAYKKNVDDVRESPALEIIWELQEWGAKVSYHDPYVKKYPDVRKGKLGLSSKPLTPQILKSNDLVLILTDHDCVDYDLVAKHAKLVVDTRNSMAKIKTVKAEVVLA
ncbi:MAG: nucleotide sugar dehydrogenase [Candidatus Omnitrophica bacterium]|nr:nucleotide sugar dehydrogenase [Candidatus Omnitrophota bacterium]MCB9770741.1 nucleotide sugar dehydrogenase [Candidatus Omnitrophota bacterium]MCB9781775.1 nucleotide sugar dehydrogenase [Candidatus Omnitrophota bacterium]